MVELRDSKPLDYVRYVCSFVLLGFACVVTFYAIFEGKTNFWSSVPGIVAFLLFIVNMTILGIVEGLQIALVELKRQHPGTYKFSHPRAYKLGTIAGSSDNTERFLMGRQVFVVFIVFFIAKLSAVNLDNLEEDFLFPVPHWFYVSLLETGFLTCVIVVIIAQLMPQIIASKFPVHFLNLRIMYYAYWICVWVEMTGITHSCWVISHYIGKLAGMPNKDVFMRRGSDVESLKDLDGSESAKSDGKDDLKRIEAVFSQTENVIADEKIPTLSKLQTLVKTLDCNMDEDTKTILRHYLDNHPEKFQKFPSVVGDKVYPAPSEVAEQFSSMGLQCPHFLLGITDPRHVPPHVVASELLLVVHHLQNTINTLLQERDELASASSVTVDNDC